MPSQIWIVIDICIVMLVLGIVHITLFDLPVLVIVPPLLVIGVIAGVWIVRKIQSRK